VSYHGSGDDDGGKYKEPSCRNCEALAKQVDELKADLKLAEVDTFVEVLAEISDGWMQRAIRAEEELGAWMTAAHEAEIAGGNNSETRGNIVACAKELFLRRAEVERLTRWQTVPSTDEEAGIDANRPPCWAEASGKECARHAAQRLDQQNVSLQKELAVFRAEAAKRRASGMEERLARIEDPALREAHRKVWLESDRFREALPDLLKDSELAGRWVVFKDGKVHATFDDIEAAYRKGIELFGVYGGQVISKVPPDEVWIG
jgi:hypothetical protein